MIKPKDVTIDPITVLIKLTEADHSTTLGNGLREKNTDCQ